MCVVSTQRLTKRHALTARPAAGHRSSYAARGFTLLELVIVMAITVILASLLMPALGGLREHTNRIISAGNMRQIGMGLTMYATDHSGRLPYSALLRSGDPRHLQEMATLRLGRSNGRFDFITYSGTYVNDSGWDGLGLLYHFSYLNVGEIYYCPSNTGEHTFDRYAPEFFERDTKIIGNYQYRGDMDITVANQPLMNLDRDARKVFLTDSLRTQQDVNFEDGYNLLRGDMSVNWFADRSRMVFNMLPTDTVTVPGEAEIYNEIWQYFDEN